MSCCTTRLAGNPRISLSHTNNRGMRSTEEASCKSIISSKYTPYIIQLFQLKVKFSLFLQLFRPTEVCECHLVCGGQTTVEDHGSDQGHGSDIQIRDAATEERVEPGDEVQADI